MEAVHLVIINDFCAAKLAYRTGPKEKPPGYDKAYVRKINPSAKVMRTTDPMSRELLQFLCSSMYLANGKSYNRSLRVFIMNTWFT